jgi:hypothetical protein
VTGITEEPSSPEFDQLRVMAEIEREARRLRRDDIVPASSERELDVLFGRLAPPAATEDYETALASAEELAYVDPHAPVVSSKLAGSAMKRFVRKVVFFYGNHLTTQVTAFATTISRSVRLLGRRVQAIEATLPGTSVRAREAFDAASTVDDLSAWGPTVGDLVADLQGRVMVGECQAGDLVRAIVERGADAYGVEPRAALADQAGVAGLEVREAEVLDHLRLVPGEALGGVVLTGCVDRLDLGAQLVLLDHAHRVLAPGGVVAIVTQVATPATSAAARTVTDLAPGRPLHPETWAHLLGTNGFESVRVIAGGTTRVFELVPGDDEVTVAINRNFERLEQLLAGPTSAAIVGRREGR